MSHQPPVPAGNQSPYPLHEAPHPHAAEPPAGTPVAKTPERRESASPAIGGSVLGILAAAGVAALAAAGAWALASRSEEPKRKSRKR